MFSFLKNHAYPIGVDIGDDTVKMVQLGENGNGMRLIAGGVENRPEDVKPGSGNWQRWAIEAIRNLTANGKFRGRNVVATMPANEVFIDHIKVPKRKDGSLSVKGGVWDPDDKLCDTVFSKICQKLPFEPDEAMIKYIPTGEDNILVIATERRKIDRHLAIYEKANLSIRSLNVWPVALINIYTRFFGRRKADIEAIVMLLDMEENCTNVVICRHKNLLFARSIPIGAKQLQSDDVVKRLVLESTTCRRHFASMEGKNQIERLIFLSTQSECKDVCTEIAREMKMPAQMGDCLAAVETKDSYSLGIDRRNCQTNWATAFGLGLS